MKTKFLLPVFLLLTIFLLSIASAYSFDNKATFTKNIDLGKYEIKNSILGIPFLQTGKVEDIILKENTFECGESCYAIKEFTTYEDIALVEDIRFYTIKEDGSRVLQDIRSYEFLLGEEIGSKIINDYETECSEIKNKNGSISDVCKEIKIGTHEEKEYKWKPYKIGEFLPKGNYVLKLVGEKKPSRTVDWQIKSNGIWTNEWAIWGSESLTEAHGITLSSTESTQSAKNGMRIHTSDVPISLLKINKTAGNDATIAYLTDSSKSVLASANFSGDSATFSPSYGLYIDTTYYLLVDKGGSTFTTKYGGTTYNITGTYFNWTGGVNTIGGDASTQAFNVISAEINFINGNITINSPKNGFSTTLEDIQFNISASQESVNIVNISILTNKTGTFQIENTTTGFSSPSANANISVSFPSNGNYLVGARACDSDGDCGYSSNITIAIDMIPPVLNSAYPNGVVNYHILGNNLTFNYSVTETNLDKVIIRYNNTNYSFTGNINSLSFTLVSGLNNATIYMNDTSGNEVTNYTSWSYKIFQNNITYTPTIYETSSDDYIINLTANSSLTAVSLVYNGTSYSTSHTGNLWSVSFSPNISGNISFYWNITYGGTYLNSLTYYQIVSEFSSIIINKTCSTGFSQARCFNFKDEKNLTTLTMDNLNYNFEVGLSNISYKKSYGNLENLTSFCLCINTSISNNFSVGSGEIQYTKSGYVDRRYYTFTGQTLTNQTVNHSLYGLSTSLATSFLFDFSSTGLDPYIEKYVTLLRWYPQLDQYNIVEMAQTDDKGETIMRVEVEDTDYRVGLYELDGTLITLLNPVRFACLASPCSYSTIVEGGSTDYTTFFDVDTSITYNETTNIWTYVWNDPSQNTDTMRFQVARTRGDSTVVICDESANGFTGVLACDTSGYTGTLKAVGYRTASPERPIAVKIINSFSTPFKSRIGLFFSFILFALLMLIGIYSPIASIIFGIIALVPAYFIGSINLEIFIGIAVLGGIIIHFMKRTG